MVRIYVDVNYAVMIIPREKTVTTFLKDTYAARICAGDTPNVGDLRIVDGGSPLDIRVTIEKCVSAPTRSGWFLTGREAVFETLGYVYEFTAKAPQPELLASQVSIVSAPTPAPAPPCTECPKYKKLFLESQEHVRLYKLRSEVAEEQLKSISQYLSDVPLEAVEN
jgi:hypothetical protein